MKTKNALFVLLIILVVALSFESCSLFGTKIDERIDAFIDDLNNSDRSNVYTNFHPDKTADYNAIKDPSTTWDIWFPVADIPYSISNLDDSDSDSVTAVISSSGTFGPSNATFKMAKDGFDWMIEELTVQGLTPVPLVD